MSPKAGHSNGGRTGGVRICSVGNCRASVTNPGQATAGQRLVLERPGAVELGGSPFPDLVCADGSHCGARISPTELKVRLIELSLDRCVEPWDANYPDRLTVGGNCFEYVGPAFHFVTSGAFDSV